MVQESDSGLDIDGLRSESGMGVEGEGDFDHGLVGNTRNGCASNFKVTCRCC